MKRIVIAFGLLISINFLSLGQHQTEFQKFITATFETKLGALNSEQDVPDILRSFSRDLSWRDVTVSIDGRVDITDLEDKQDLERKLNSLARRPGIKMTWEIAEYNELTKRESSYIASLNVNVSLYANGKIIRTGVNNVQIVAVKKSDFFEIVYLDILQISEAQYIGPCYVRIEKKEEKSYTVDVAHPNGNTYKTFSSAVDVINVADPFKKIIIEGTNTSFYWNPKGEFVSLSTDGQKLGQASTIENALLVIVKVQGKDTCSSVIRTAQKQ